MQDPNIRIERFPLHSFFSVALSIARGTLFLFAFSPLSWRSPLVVLVPGPFLLIRLPLADLLPVISRRRRFFHCRVLGSHQVADFAEDGVEFVPLHRRAEGSESGKVIEEHEIKLSLLCADFARQHLNCCLLRCRHSQKIEKRFFCSPNFFIESTYSLRSRSNSFFWSSAN